MRTPVKVLFAAFAVGLLAMPAWAQDSAPTTLNDAISGYESAAHESFQGLATDWSSHHVVYSKPEPGSDTEDTVQQDPRYWMQQIRRGLPDSEASVAAGVQADDGSQWDSSAKKKKKVKGKKKKPSTLTGLWEVNMDSGAAVGNEMYPATFTATTSPSCANVTQPDFVVYNTNLPGGTPATATAASAGTFGVANNTPAGTFTITNTFTTASLVLTAAANNTGNDFLVVSNTGTGSAANATSLAARITALGGPVGVTATSSGSNVTVTALAAGTDGNSITLSSTLTRFTLNLTALAGGTNAATIMAFDNLYKTTCSVPVPTPYWSYNTGGTDHTSPVISPRGDQVAFVQSSSGGAASLVVLKFAAGNGHLGSVALTSNGSYPSCTAPCMISLPFNTGNDDTNSSPFEISFGSTQGTLYVGDNKGLLHKFTNIFTSGTPVETVGGGWPVTVGTTSQVLSSPVADANTNNIFVPDNSGNLRYVKDTGSTTGTCATGSHLGVVPCLGTTNGLASGPTVIALGGTVVDGPLLDVSTTKVFWFDSVAGTASTDFIQNVVQTSEALATATQVTVPFNNGSTGVEAGNMHAGAFDNTYFTTGPPSGFLYICAVNPGHANHPSLFRIGFGAGGVMDASDDGNVREIAGSSTSPNECSPITEVKAATTDDFFVSVQANGSLTGGAGCSGACLYSFLLSGQTFPSNSTAGFQTTAGTAGSTSGLSVDNVFSATGASNIYFTPLGNSSCITVGGTGGCATQASQSALN
jgi:hypothetical protein